jgi:nicotinamidase-related amidase
MGKTAIIVIDLQNEFMNGRTKPLVKKIRRHIESGKYDFVVFSKFVNSPDSNFVKKLRWNKCKESPEKDLALDPFEFSKNPRIFEKHTYSLFESREFRDFLEKNKVSKLYFCGLDLEACVLASVFDAFDRDYDYEILFELCGSSAGKNMFGCARKIIGRNF